jgi:hypothetical protein
LLAGAERDPIANGRKGAGKKPKARSERMAMAMAMAIDAGLSSGCERLESARVH